MLLQGFVDIHRIEAIHVETRCPHIDNQRNLEIRLGLFERFGIGPAVFIRTQQIVQRRFIVLVAGHDQLDLFDRTLLPLADITPF